jgi:hypothetical protein
MDLCVFDIFFLNIQMDQDAMSVLTDVTILIF